MPYEPVVPKGQHLGTSHEVDGAVTGHLFDDGTNELKGHAAWRWVDDPEEDYSSSYENEPPRELTPEERELLEKLAAMILVGIIVGVKAAAPHVQRWWNDKAVPGAKSAWRRIRTLRRKPSGEVASTSSSSKSRVTLVESAPGSDLAVVDPKISMSSVEWGQRFRAMLAAGAFKEEQQRILASARIEDDVPSLEATSSPELLNPQQFADRIKLMLEANPTLLDKETAAELMRVFSARSKRLEGPERDEPGQPETGVD